jgi:hypothetical protein
MNLYSCPLDSSVTVIECGPKDELGARFADKGHAFCIYGEGVSAIGPVIVVNSEIREEEWFTENHLTAIFAHELGHISRGEDEQQAERWAIDFLSEINEDAARALLVERGIA